MKQRTLFLLGFLLLVTALRLWIAASSELSPDEAYYTLWSQHPDICYYSKGPMVAFTILASTSLFGQTEFGVRFFSPLLGLGTSLLVYWLARKLYREQIAFWAALSLNLIPIFNVGSVVMTIDPLSIFFWTAALCTFWEAIQTSTANLVFWVLTGVLIGIGFLCKYTNAAQLFSIVLILLFAPKLRAEFRRPGLYLLLAAFLPFIIPPLVWNQQHEWITLSHLSSRGGLDRSFSPNFSDVAEFVGGHLAVYSPLLFCGLLAAMVGSLRRVFKQTKVLFLLGFALPLLLGYLLLSFQKSGEPNWTAPAFISLGILAAAWWYAPARDRRGVGIFCLAALITGAVMSLLVLNTDVLRAVGIPWTYRLDPSSRLRGWKTAAEAIADFRQRFEAKAGQKAFLIGNKYQTASMLSFYLSDRRVEGPGHPPVYIPESQDFQNEFSFWPRYDEFLAPSATPKTAEQSQLFSEEEGVNPFLDRNALFITDRPENDPPQNLLSSFARCELVAVMELRRRNLPLRELRIFACYQYQTLPL
jgi:4-amino-4-deoxy-L-arabinose transferase-like glycosyltransferase